MSKITDFAAGENDSNAEALRKDVFKNIELILNSRCRSERQDLNNDPLIYKSVLGFGLKDFCGLTRTHENIERLQEEIVAQINWFEPRIKPSSLQVHLLSDIDDPHGMYQIGINGQIMVNPVFVDFFCVTKIDLESGECRVLPGVPE